MDLANWNWKAVHRLIWERFGLSLFRSNRLTYLRRLGFAFKRPKKRLLKADEEKREAFVVGTPTKFCGENSSRASRGDRPRAAGNHYLRDGRR